MSIGLLVAGLTAAALVFCVPMGKFGKRSWRARKERRRVTESVDLSMRFMRQLAQVPDALVPSDLRQFLLLLLNGHLELIRAVHPEHALLDGLHARLVRLSCPAFGDASGAHRLTLGARHQVARELATLALLIDEAARGAARDWVDPAHADIARASAMRAARHINVEAIRQAAADAEHVGAFGQAIRLIRQAQVLCRALPPLTAASLGERLAHDMTRLGELGEQGLGEQGLKSMGW